MNRAIKFRAWDKDQKRMFDDILAKRLDWLTREMKLESEELLRMIAGRFSDYALMQFTGLRDKDGREIYEGDVLRSDLDEVMMDEVVWDELIASFELKGVSTGFSQRRIEDWQWHIVGNIYENPELLSV